MIWLKFAAIQLVMLVATVLGWFVLLPFCIAKAWTSAVYDSRDEKRAIDEWKWEPLNVLYGNIEDGVSGQQALIWNKTGTARVPYMPNAPAWWRAYCWSGFRNSCDNLKYVFADHNGPLVTFKVLGRTAKIGWQGGLPVMSI